MPLEIARCRGYAFCAPESGHGAQQTLSILTISGKSIMQPPHKIDLSNWADYIDAIANNDIELDGKRRTEGSFVQKPTQKSENDPATGVQNWRFSGS